MGIRTEEPPSEMPEDLPPYEGPELIPGDLPRDDEPPPDEDDDDTPPQGRRL
jgi:hypothetical protein